jgi:hypothetical protein
MSDPLSSILKLYGLPAAFAAAILAALLALCVWGLAHFSAKPGTEVSVLWGLARYTKASDHDTLGRTPRGRSEQLDASQLDASKSFAEYIDDRTGKLNLRAASHKWDNTDISWTGFVAVVRVADDSKSTSFHIGLQSEKPNLKRNVAVFRKDVSADLLATFDAIRMGDKVHIEGTVRDAISDRAKVLPTRIERLN